MDKPTSWKVRALSRMLSKKESRLEALESLIRHQYPNLDEFGQSCADDMGLGEVVCIWQ